MKKFICLLLVAVLFGMLNGCGQKKDTGVFKADDEIFTYRRVDPDKTQIIVSRTGNIPVLQLCNAFEALNPDIQIIYLDITGGNSDYMPVLDWISKGTMPDVVVSASDFLDTEASLKYLENLSDHPIINRYEAEALQRTAVDSNVYWLPGPSDISAMMYNKTLFDQYGWSVPKTFDEFVRLCDRIREDTNGEIEPWNPNAKYPGELLTVLEAFTYEELFGGLQNRSWYANLLDGKATIGEHMKPYFDVLQTLIDHGALRKEHFSYSATARGKEFGEGKIAMINVNIYNADNDRFDFAFMPFPTTKGDLGYLCNRYSCYVGLPKKERTEKQNDAVRRFLEFFSSAEGQSAYIANAMMMSNVKGVTVNQADDLAALRPAIEAGHLFGLLEFTMDAQQKCKIDLRQFAADMTNGDATGEACMAKADELWALDAESVAAAPSETVASASESFTVLETSFLMADVYREAARADIGLIAHNAVYRGNLMRIFAGDITQDMITVFKPRSFANGSTLVKAAMTGRQIMDALNHPLGNEETVDCVYAYSGLKCEVAPWNELGEKYLKVEMADGSAIQLDKRYAVAFWAGTVRDEYVTETLAVYEDSWESLMAAKLGAYGAIAPAKDGRIKLVWD